MEIDLCKSSGTTCDEMNTKWSGCFGGHEVDEVSDGLNVE